MLVCSLIMAVLKPTQPHRSESERLMDHHVAGHAGEDGVATEDVGAAGAGATTEVTEATEAMVVRVRAS